MKRKRKSVTENELESVEAVDKIFKSLRGMFSVTSDALLAEQLELSPAAIYNHRARGTIPFRQIVLACLRNGFSLDDAFSLITQEVAELPGEHKQIRAYFEGEKPIFLSTEVIPVLGKSNVETLFYLAPSNTSFDPLKPGDLALVSNDDKHRRQDGMFLVRINEQESIKRIQYLPGSGISVSPASSTSPHDKFQLDLNSYEWWEEKGKKLSPNKMTMIGRIIWTGENK